MIYMITYLTTLFISKMYCPLVSKCEVTGGIIRSFCYFRQPTSLKYVTEAIYQQISSFLKD